jgi:tRNA-splicing ligase RtcB
MNTKGFLRLGAPLGQVACRATDFISRFIPGGGDKSRLHEEVAAIVADPAAFVNDPLRDDFAKRLFQRARAYWASFPAQWQRRALW